MDLLIISISVCSWIIVGTSGAANVDPNILNNSSDSNKDMYVINAMVYQVGIITNKTDGNFTDSNNLGNEESVTFFRKNGSNVDLSGIPAPLMTNVTAQRMVGVAPKGSDQLPWSALQQLASLQTPTSGDTGSPDNRIARDVNVKSDSDQSSDEADQPDYDTNMFFAKLFKREESPADNHEETPVEIVQGSAAIPSEAGVQSLAIPPLLTFNNNFSEIPVPIPNTSVVHYAKVNTLIKNTP